MFRLVKCAVVALAVGAATIGGTSVALADAGAQGVAAGSPGILSGNVIQVPVNVPIAACGNSLGVISMLNGTSGNACVNGSVSDGNNSSTGAMIVDGDSDSDSDSSGILYGDMADGDASTGAMAVGAASDSPGILSGNVIQVPVSVPVAVCGNSLNVIGMLNPAAGNACVNS
ncbi:chaplin [Streptomyces sp. NPDC127084]|uniref:chaplin n=1 Tax=Streptomyces sp. NPDC127084 TaxID=3347133 RepID=UPI003657F82E